LLHPLGHDILILSENLTILKMKGILRKIQGIQCWDACAFLVFWLSSGSSTLKPIMLLEPDESTDKAEEQERWIFAPCQSNEAKLEDGFHQEWRKIRIERRGKPSMIDGKELYF
jgi:hypothetical protein